MKKTWLLLLCLVALLVPVHGAEDVSEGEVEAEAVEELTLPELTGETTTLESLTPYSLRTYESVDDPDTNAFGYCGPEVVAWDSGSDMDNYGTSYTSGVKIGCNDSRYISRFAADYKIDKAYGLFIGHIAVHVMELRSTVAYTVTFLGDGKTLFTSEVINNASEPQIFIADLTGVTKLTVEVKAVSDDAQFYNYEYVCLVENAMEIIPEEEEEVVEDTEEESTEAETETEETETPETEVDSETETEEETSEPEEVVDLDCSDWAEADILTAMALDMVPSQLEQDFYAPISRVDFCQMMVQTMFAMDSDFLETFQLDISLQPFPDSDSIYVSMAYQMGIVNGTSDTTFSPDDSILRMEAAAMLARVATALGYTEAEAPLVFVDADTLEDWAVAPVDFVSANGIMEGTGEALFSPYETYTVEQSIVTALRLYNLGQ